MRRAILVAVLIAAMALVAAAAVSASQSHKVNYVRVGVTDDGRPVYVAIIHLNYINADVIARLFGGAAPAGSTGSPSRYPSARGYDGGANGRFGTDDSFGYGRYGRGY